jgi:hypothetical protein
MLILLAKSGTRTSQVVYPRIMATDVDDLWFMSSFGEVCPIPPPVYMNGGCPEDTNTFNSMEVRDTLAHVLPKTTPLHLDTWSIEERQARITLLVSSTQAAARCPPCETPARHVHRRDTRTLADLPWSGYRVTWRLRVRKFFCRTATCSRRIFTERLPGVASPWARRTLRLTAHLLAIGLALGGAAGVRLSQSLGLIVSRNTLLGVIRRTPSPAMTSPRVLSVDAFALRKRHKHGQGLLYTSGELRRLAQRP